MCFFQDKGSKLGTSTAVWKEKRRRQQTGADWKENIHLFSSRFFSSTLIMRTRKDGSVRCVAQYCHYAKMEMREWMVGHKQTAL
ncbi:hypothetical protein PGIGA_G00110140 [Pangasianodon gigas]|uniref:Uncharacterized protein n=1 Tax=Pangasianodon gigas TaxID=30993 RepID=A0ACC5W8V0_PANGG|nr:hypothetical protein [Pangasianodon gigas]